MIEDYALIPKYMEHFQCIGAECEDTCCALWHISIDKRSYNKYMNVKDRAWRERFKGNVTKIETNAHDAHYASMKLDEQTGGCTMLDNGLCSIQANLGEDYLSPTCATYPRKINEVSGVQEISATPSCPEIARIMLLEPNGIEFIQGKSLRKPNIYVNRKVSANTGEFSSFLWDIRIAAIEILQNREFELPHRLLLLGWLCDQIYEATKNGDFSVVTDEIAKFKYQMETNTELRDYKVFPSNTKFQLTFLNKLIMNRAEQKIWNIRYRECLDDYINGLKDENEDPENIMSHYIQAYTEYYLPYIKDHEYILENYLVNTVYHTLFPVSGKLNIFEQFMMLAVNFSLIKMHLIGIAKYHEGLTDEIVVKLIQSFSKNYEHNNQFVKDVCEELKKANYDTIGHLSLLIKND
ncbi:flagellin lysine-N-methylase [Paenibacillus sp. Leaf72]|uniref:flagellin lysine-N-methylase n=1 Tax=Paenibacillus sp. Leaf72 TaxID=1736234 RepID=UPI0006FAA04A|nr:flagellin lysine-N-methylase [Paenibacillus sp. Leaf72]KQO11013.1 hypothetical protein ASF12_11625 [Paenibacillus sp. Leaf72]